MKKNISKTLENTKLKRSKAFNENTTTDVGISLKNGSLLKSSNDLLFHLDEDTVESYGDTQTSDELNWESVNINLDTVKFNEKREKALSQIANSRAVITQKLYAEFSFTYRTKIEFICNHVNSALMAQNLFTTPTPVELEKFGIEDYSIIVNLNINENSNVQNTIDVNLASKEILIQGEQSLYKMGYGIFYILNRLMSPQDKIEE